MQDTKILKRRIALILIAAGVLISFGWLITGLAMLEPVSNLINFGIVLVIFD